MKKIIITGGSGSVGTAFIRKYYDKYKFYNISRNENSCLRLVQAFPRVHNHIASIENLESVLRVYDEVRPDIVIHSAAMKHIDIIENEAIQACRINVVGSLNIITASLKYDVEITIGISTDKACLSESVYGATKSLMEKCFINANTDNNRFSICRFANVAHSNGSVLPYWIELKKQGKSLKLTDPCMNRLMFTQDEAAELIYRTIVWSKNQGGLIISTKMKSVNMLELANLISDNIEIVGKRPGEKINEDLIAKKELPYTEIINGLIIIRQEKTNPKWALTLPYNSKTAEKMTKNNMKKMVFWEI